MKSQKGFALIEVLIVVSIIIIVVCGILGVVVIPTGNFWYTQSGVQEQLLTMYPDETGSVSHIQRNIIRKSKIYMTTGTVYYLDTNVLWNYRISQ